MKQLLIITCCAVFLSGCASMSGFDASSNFSCKAPDGVLCESMSGIYANAEQHNLPGQQVHHGGASTKTTDMDVPQVAQDSVVLTKPMSSGTPIRSAPRVLRLWFAPWEDTDGDLHDQSYVYLTVDSGQWLIEHNRRRIQHAYQPVHAPQLPPAISSKSEDPISQVAGSEQGATSIGVAQSRPDAQEAAAMVGNIQTPAQIN